MATQSSKNNSSAEKKKRSTTAKRGRKPAATTKAKQEPPKDSKKEAPKEAPKEASKASSKEQNQMPKVSDVVAHTFWAVAFLVLTICSFLGWFSVENSGAFVDELRRLERGFVGVGWRFCALSFLALSVLQLFGGETPRRWRKFCIVTLPAIIGMFFHSVVGAPLEWNFHSAEMAYNLGNFRFSGGVFGGYGAQLLIGAIGRVGSVFVTLMLMMIYAMVLTKTTPQTLWEYVEGMLDKQKEQEAPHLLSRFRFWGTYDPEDDDPQKYPQKFHRRVPIATSEEENEIMDSGDLGNETLLKEVQRVITGKEPLDIPLDGETLSKEDIEAMRNSASDRNKQPESIFKKGKKKFFESKAGQALFAEPLTDEPVPSELVFEEIESVQVQPAMIESEVGELEQIGLDMGPPTKPAPKQEKVVPDAQIQRDLAQASAVQVENYQAPPLELLATLDDEKLSRQNDGETKGTQKDLLETIQSFGISGRIVYATRGPAVTRYEFELERGIKLSKLTNLARDIALCLGVFSVRIAPVVGKNSVVGIEVPNRKVTPVSIRSVLASQEFQESYSSVSFAVGKDISNRNVVGDIARMPHLLIAGTTGSGKSVCTNSMIISLLYKSSPDDVRFLMVDPKMVELSNYNGIPHLLIPVVTDPKKAAGALQWAVFEMMQRYQDFANIGARDIESYNRKVQEHEELGKKKPKIVIFIDELADLMIAAAKEVEEAICRVAQMGRAAGMHLVIATQRPSSDVITGLMKANIPSRIALAVASSLDSRIILDSVGAEDLVGNGDMLFAPLGKPKRRVQGCYISEEEVNEVIRYIKEHSGAVEYNEDVMHQVDENARRNEKGSKGGSSALNVAPPDSYASSSEPQDDRDPLFYDAVDVVVELQMASASTLQRKLKVGYARAARLVDQMEEYGYVGPFEGSKPRTVLVTKEKWAEKKMQLTGQQMSLDSGAELAKMMSDAPQKNELPPF